MKALVIAPEPFFSPRGTPFSVYYRTLVTSELGVDIDLLTYGEGQDVDIPRVRIIRIPRFAFLGNVKVGPSLLKLFLDVFIAIWAVVLLLRNKYDYVHAHEEAVFICRFLKSIFRFKLVYDMHSALPQQLTNFHFTGSKLLIGIFNKLENSSLCASDAIITICPDLSRYVTHLISDTRKLFLIENSIFDPSVRVLQSQVDSNGNTSSVMVQGKPANLPENKHFIVYAGTLEPYQGIEILIEAFKKVVAEHPDAYLLIVGGAKDQVAFFSDLAEKLGLDGKVHFTGGVPQVMAKYYAGLASVLVSPRIEGTNTPLKIYEQLASDIPLIATNIYSHTQVLNEDVAFLVEPNPEDMARGILAAFKSGKDNHRIVKNARRLYEQRYSRPVYVKKLQHILELLS